MNNITKAVNADIIDQSSITLEEEIGLLSTQIDDLEGELDQKKHELESAYAEIERVRLLHSMEQSVSSTCRRLRDEAVKNFNALLERTRYNQEQINLSCKTMNPGRARNKNDFDF